MESYNFTLTGITPLLMHKDDVLAADMLSDWRKHPDNKNKSKAGDDRSPAWTWQTYLYIDEATGTVAMPSSVIMTSLRLAGASVILKKQTTYKSLTQSGLTIDDEYCQLLVPAGDDWATVDVLQLAKIKDKDFIDQANEVRKLGFKLDLRRAAVGASKHVRVRPRFDRWMVKGKIDIVDPDFRYEALTQIMEIAGQRKGIGDWRPGAKTPGPYGRFGVTLKRSTQ